MRPLAEIVADIAEAERALDAARARMAGLMTEETAARTARQHAVVKNFDEGASRQQLMDAFGLTYGQVANYLNLAGRSERQRRKAQLPPEARVHYDKLLRAKVPSRVAAQIAESLPS